MSMWDELTEWELRNDASVLTVIDAFGLRNDLQFYIYFDEDAQGKDERWICLAEDIPHKTLVACMREAAETCDMDTTYNEMVELVALKVRDAMTTERHYSGNFYDDVTKRYYKWKELTTILKERSSLTI